MSARFIGVLGVMLAITAGQATIALLLDVFFSVGRTQLGLTGLVSAVLAILAVLITGPRGRRRGFPRA